MIVEFFGPPGAGKTTLANALLRRLRERGHTTEIALVHQPDKLSSFDLGGFGYALVRIGKAVAAVLTMVLHPTTHKNTFRLVASLVRILPPKNLIWYVRVSQYMLRLSHTWRRASNIDPVIIFDQGFIQAVCSLAVFSRSIDETAFLRALNVVPKPDIVICIKIEREAQLIRLHRRQRREPIMARLFEASPATNLQFNPVIERVSAWLQEHGHSVIIFQAEFSSIDGVIDEIVRTITSKLGSNSGAIARGITESAQAGEPCMICDSGIQTATFPLLRAATSALSITGGSLDEKSDDLARASFLGLLTYVGGAGLTSAVQLLVARLLRAEAYGVYSYVWAWVSLLSYGATLGFVAFVLRFTSAYRASEQWPLMYGSIRFAVSRSLAAALMASGVGLLIVWLWSDHLGPQLASSMAIGIVTIPPITLHLVGASIVRVFGGFVAAIFPERVLRDGLLLAIMAFAAWGTSWPPDARIVLAGALISTAAALAFIIYAAFTLWPEQIKRVDPIYLPRQWWAFAFPVMAMMALEIVMTRTGVLVLGWSRRISEAGVFALAFNLAMLIQLSRAAVSIYFSPSASETHQRGDLVGLSSLFARATVLSLAGGAILALPVLLFAGPMLRLFGQDFAGAVHIVQILVIGQLIAAAAGPQQNLLVMTGHERSTAAIMLVFAVLMVAGCAIATAHDGAIGAAIATSGALVAWNVTMAIHVERCLGIKPGLMLAFTALLTRRGETTWQANSKRWIKSGGTDCEQEQ
jgi:O-antigen/teichoic acid export membrane protein/thymidylate kinase